MGGPADVRELPGLTISKLAVSEMANNAYLLRDTATGEALLIDAAADPAALLALIGDADAARRRHDARPLGPPPALTDLVVVATGATTVAHPPTPRPAGVRRSEGRARRHRDVGNQTLEVIHLRGHTPGSIALVWRGPGDAGVHLFTGDSLFPGGVGNTQKDAARFSSLIDDVEQRLFGTLPDETGSTSATARTRRSALSARTSPSGAREAGDPRRPRDRRDGAGPPGGRGRTSGTVDISSSVGRPSSAR